MGQNNPYPFRTAAHRFVIWRTAKSVDWKTTIGELARVTGLHYETVRAIVKDAGWNLLGTGDDVRERDLCDVDLYMQGNG